MPQTVIIAPTAEPLHLAEAKAHLRQTLTEEDTLIVALIAAARAHVETFTRLALVTRTLTWRFDAFPARGWLEFPVAPVRKVNSVKYIDTDGVQQTWSAASYRLDLASEPARLTPAWGETWPFARGVVNAVEIECVAGYITPFTANDASDLITAVPSHVYVDGAPIELSNSGGTLPASLAALTTYYGRDVAGAGLRLAATAGGSAIDITASGTGTHFLGRLPDPMRAALLLLVQYHEQRNANTALRDAAELLLTPYSTLRV